MSYYIQGKPVDKETSELKSRQMDLNITGAKAFKEITEKFPDMHPSQIMDIIENKFPEYVESDDPASALFKNGGGVGSLVRMR